MDDSGPGTSPKKMGIVVFSGGTAANFLVDVFGKIIERRRCPLSYIIPISDNGGSSSELIRVLGGPSVGDIRSRLVRLIPNDAGDEENTALRALFEHRLCSDPAKAKQEWGDIVEGNHLLWTFISSAKRELIRSVLNTLNLEIVKRSRPLSRFNFSKASVGNMFLTGARLFSGSFEAAIYLLAIICSIPPTVAVLPAINSNFTHHIAAALADGTTLTGQVAISHPSAPTAVPDSAAVQTPMVQMHMHDSPRAATPGPAHGQEDAARRRARMHDAAAAAAEDATLPGSLPVLRTHNISFSKDDEEDLPARVRRVWYINPYGHEIWPVANPKALAAVRACGTIVYSIGSLYTSIIPSLILRGVGAAIADGDGGDGEGGAAGQRTKRRRTKVLILNGTVDRETGPRSDPMGSVDFVKALARAARESRSEFDGEVPDAEVLRYVTHLVYLRGTPTTTTKTSSSSSAPVVDEEGLARLGVRCVGLRGTRLERERGGGVLRYEDAELTAALEQIMDDDS